MSAGKKSANSKSMGQSTPSPSPYDVGNIVQVICPNCGQSTILNQTMKGFKACYNCGSALFLPKPKEQPNKDGENENNVENEEEEKIEDGIGEDSEGE